MGYLRVDLAIPKRRGEEDPEEPYGGEGSSTKVSSCACAAVSHIFAVMDRGGWGLVRPETSGVLLSTKTSPKTSRDRGFTFELGTTWSGGYSMTKAGRSKPRYRPACPRVFL
jgi:hypothetical protein